MLPAQHRLTESASFATAVRSGRRAGGPTLVVHLMARDTAEPVLVGFVVSKAVGNAVVRNRVKRRLRAVMAERLRDLPAGSVVVVRALPASAGIGFTELDRDVAQGLNRVLKQVAA